METTTISSGNPLMISTTNVDQTQLTTTSSPSSKSSSLDTGQMRSTSPFTPNSYPLHSKNSSSSSSSPPAATTACSPLLMNDNTILSPTNESSFDDQEQQLQQQQQTSLNDGNESVSSSFSDVETFNGKIVYNPDGSAYIIEGPDSDGSDVEAEISQEGSIIDARGHSPNYGTISFPQIVSAFHISRSSSISASELYQSLCETSATSPTKTISKPIASTKTTTTAITNETKATEVPVMHSYRVFTLRNNKTNNSDDSNTDDNDNFLENFDKPQEEELSSLIKDEKNAANIYPTVPVKPILMCFICKLSFGYTKSFVTHAIGEQHHLSLNDDEKRILSSKNISAIIQGVGKEKRPLLSFLQPKSLEPTPIKKMSIQQKQQQQIDAQRFLAGLQMAAVASALSRSNNSPNDKVNHQLSSSQSIDDDNDEFDDGGTLNDDDNEDKSTINNDVVKESISPKITDSAATINFDKNNSNDITTQFASEIADLASLEKFAQAAAVAAAAQQHQQQQLDLHSIAAVMAAVAASNNNNNNTNKITGQNRTPSPGSMSKSSISSPKNSQSSSSPLFTSNSGPTATTNDNKSSISSLFNNSQSDNDTSAANNILASVVNNHVSRTTSNHPPLLMQHSRNSCKTLKCPKCNWHYKYQETLEIHMKEKHPENEMNCIYCLTNQAHPRLARGETYTCGYKPYRCDVCNYSTTTKGNLSIHMQSDKHINNVQELQNGNIPATATEHLLQSQALAAAVAQVSAAAAAVNVTGTTSPITSTTTSTTLSNSSGAPTPSSVAAIAAVAAAQQQDAKNPQAKISNNNNNNIAISNSPSSVQQTPPSTPNPSNNNNNNSAPATGNGKQKATWRCDVCNYETNVARNLRIHMTSEKHTHNIMILKQNVTQMQQLNAIQQAGILNPELLQLNPGFLAAAAAAAAAAAGINNPNANNNNLENNNSAMQPEVALADMAYNHALLMMASQQQQRTMAALMQQQQQQQQMNDPQKSTSNGLQATFDMEPNVDPNVANIANSTPFDENCHLYHCCVCGTFSSDSIDTLNQHLQCDRTRTREEEVLMSISGSYICKLCSYKTNLKANFQLHCKTDKHLQRLQHLNHIKEGVNNQQPGTNNNNNNQNNSEIIKLKLLQMPNPIQVIRCNVCNYYTNSIHKLQLHSANPRHDLYSRIFNHLQISELNISGNNNNKYYHCQLCSISTTNKIQLIQHLNSIKHLRNENLRRLKQSSNSNNNNNNNSQQIANNKEHIDEDICEMLTVKEYNPGDNNIVFENLNEEDFVTPPTSSSSSSLLNDVDSLMLKNVLMEQVKLVGQLQQQQQQSSEQQQESSSSIINCPFCPYSNQSELHVQMHILTVHPQQPLVNDLQHSQQQQQMSTIKSNNNPPPPPPPPPPSILCPLCQEPFSEKDRLECHLVETHNVKKEGVQRLMILVDTSELDKYNSEQQQNKSSNDINQMNRDNVNDDDINDDVGAGDLNGSNDDDINMIMTMMDNSDNNSINNNNNAMLNNANALLLEHLMCPICNRMYLNLDELFNHMSTESHYKQINNNGNNHYQCWRNACAQTFKTIATLQQHYKDQHFSKCIKLMSNNNQQSSSSITNASVSDRHVYKYRCTQCSLAFKTLEKLQIHSQYHLIRAATQCVICGRSFRSIESLQKHVESSHSNLNDDELEQYKANLLNNQLLFAFGRNGGILDPSTTELLRKESYRNNDNDDNNNNNNDDVNESMDIDNGVIDLASNNSNIKNENDNHSLDNNVETNNHDNVGLQMLNGANGATSNMNIDNKNIEDYLNSQHLAEDNYNDPNRRFKCHRCKVAFTRQSYLTAHNKTLLHRKGEKMSYPMEKYLDPNRPFKCEICKESFTQKNILLVHYNSVSHLHRLKQSMKECSAAVAASVASNNNSSIINETCNEDDDNNENKLYKCNLCKVSYSMASSLHNHLRSTSHQQRTSKLHELAQSGQLDLSLPLIEPINHHNDTSNNSSKINMNAETSAKTSPITSPNSSNKFPEILMSNLNEQQQQQQALAFQQAALNLALAAGTNSGSIDANNSNTTTMVNGQSSSSSSPFTCVKCGAAFISQEAQHQHQQLCGLFGNITNINDTMQLIQSQQQQVKQQALSKLSNLPLYKNKPQLYKHLLETWGFEIVMQFNESNEKIKKSQNNGDNAPDESIDNNNDNGEQQQTGTNNDIDNNIVNDQQKTDSIVKQNDDEITTENKQEDENIETTNETNQSPPELNKCRCDICLKEFSSIWVLKAHREEIHKDVIPLDVVELFADEYRNEYDRKFCNGNPNDENNKNTEDTNNNEDNNEIKRNNDPITDNHSLQSNPTPSTSDQTINPQEPSASNMMTAEQLANMNQIAANNLVQLLPNLSPNATPAEIAAANQMAAQIQFSQLLMSMGLAGMAAGMPMPPGMNVPFAAAAAMGIPPQLIPVMMADPMMAAAAAFNNPALAAAAAAAQLNQQNQPQVPPTNSTPGTPSPAPSSTTIPPVAPAPVIPISPSVNPTQTPTAAAAAAAAASASQQQKRARTRISDDQLKVLRQYFDINNSPTEEQLIEMSHKSGLPMKVIKHWFRNTLFKERQRNKDSPYNFNNPPSTFLNLDEYEKTGEAKVFTLDDLKKSENDNAAPGTSTTETSDDVNGKEKSIVESNNNDNNNVNKPNDSESECEGKISTDFKSSSSNKDTDYATSDDEEIKQRNHLPTKEQQPASSMIEMNNESSMNKHLSSLQSQHQQQDFDQMSKTLSYQTNSPPPSESSMSSMCESVTNPIQQQPSSASIFAGLSNFNHGLPPSNIASSSPLQFALDAAQRSQLTAAAVAVANHQSNMITTPPPPNVAAHSSSGKRANRTRFTDYQIKVLQEFFESNAYPKDDDLEYLSKLLNLSPRVIVVWFQNARQKARKVYENQPPTTPVGEDDGTGRFQRTPGLNYQCKKCLQVFQRYYELIKHQKSSCFKDENPLAAQIRMAAEARAHAASPNISTSRDSSTPIDRTRSSTATPEKMQLNMMASPNSVSSPSSNANANKASPINNTENQTFRCDKCPMVFNRIEQWRDHQIVHLVNSNIFQGANPFGLIQQLNENPPTTSPLPQQSQPLAMTSNSPQQSPNSMIGQSGIKRKIMEQTDDDDDDDESRDFDSMSGNGNNSNSSDQTPRDKRLRTTILPEQLDYLYQKYQLDSNPSRKMLESIAKEVGLKKRVVQVWFQNTRARERKGQFRAHQQVIHKRCPFCRALFKARSALESHLATRHADQYTKGDINIDNLPDGDPSEDGDMINDLMNNADSSQMVDVMKRYEDSVKKYLDGINIQGKDGSGQLPAELAFKMMSALTAAEQQQQQQQASFNNNNNIDNDNLSISAANLNEIANSNQFHQNNRDDEATTIDDSLEDGSSDSFVDSDAEEEIDFDDNINSAAFPSSGISTTTVNTSGASSRRSLTNTHKNSSKTSRNNSKRFRTQMTTTMIKVMKSIFVDYKTPTMTECQTLGRELGLSKRVVQVWFQNARAKDKKSRSSMGMMIGQQQYEQRSSDRCNICNIKYKQQSMQEHLFSKLHIDRLKNQIDNNKQINNNDIDDFDDMMYDDDDVDDDDFPIASSLCQQNLNESIDMDDNNEQQQQNEAAQRFLQQLQMLQNLTANSNNNNSSSNNLAELIQSQTTSAATTTTTNGG